MRLLLSTLFLIAMFSGSSYLIVTVSKGFIKQDMALDLVEACIEAVGASRECTLNYDVNGTYLNLSVGGVEVYCHSGRIQTC